MHPRHPPHLPGLTCASTLGANAWLVDAPRGWILVDTGFPGYAGRIVHQAQLRYGKATRPHAIVLTHGHIDHAGSAARLARLWRVPVFAHPHELPFLDGRAAYVPTDPAAPRVEVALARGLSQRSRDLGRRLSALPIDGSVPFLPGWAWLHTPGHSPGHVSLLRRSDGVLLAGDALSVPPTAFTADWVAAHHSLLLLAALTPRAVATGHGPPLAGAGIPALLRALAASLPRTAKPAVPRALAVGALAFSAGLALRSWRRSPAHG